MVGLLILVLSNNLFVLGIAVAWTCDSRSILTHHPHQLQHLLLQLPMRKNKHALILGCHLASFQLVPWLPRVVSQPSLGRLWPPGNWSSLLSDYHENHLICVDMSLIVLLGFSLREYSPWAAARQLAEPLICPSIEPPNLSGLKPGDLTWIVLRLLASITRTCLPPLDRLEDHLILVDSIKIIRFGLCNVSLELIVSPLFFLAVFIYFPY
jgi:hypothetical protein